MSTRPNALGRGIGALLPGAPPAAGFEAPAPVSDDAPGEIAVDAIDPNPEQPRRDFDAPSPLTTLSSEDIEFTPLPTLEETLNRMPQVAPGYGRASNNPGDGTATVDLRHMGAGRSL